MAEVIPHFCTGTGCEALHGGTGRETEAVKIAKINADRDIEVARLARAEAKLETAAAVEQTETLAEAQVETAEVQAAAAVAEAVVENEVLEEVVNPEPDPVPVEISAPEPDPEPGPAPPPEKEPEPESGKSSGGWWAGYR